MRQPDEWKAKSHGRHVLSSGSLTWVSASVSWVALKGKNEPSLWVSPILFSRVAKSAWGRLASEKEWNPGSDRHGLHGACELSLDLQGYAVPGGGIVTVPLDGPVALEEQSPKKKKRPTRRLRGGYCPPAPSFL